MDDFKPDVVNNSVKGFKPIWYIKHIIIIIIIEDIKTDFNKFLSTYKRFNFFNLYI